MADLAARHARVAATVESGVAGVLASGRYVGGPVVANAERRLASSFGWAYGIGVNSGTDALVYAMQAIGVGPGDEVIVPAVTFFATAGAVARIGAVPVVADVRADLPLLDVTTLPVSSRTRAIIAVHLYGEVCVLPPLAVPIVDDLAQAAGARFRTGIIGAVSFYPTKTLGAAGDAGIVLTDDAGAADRVRRLTHHGMTSAYVHERVGGSVGANSRMDAVQAAVLLAHLDDLPARVATRRGHAARYDATLPPSVRLLPRHAEHPVHHYVVRVSKRDALASFLAARGVETAIYYPRSLARQPALEPQPPTPNADEFCAECLALPVHECLHASQIDEIVTAVRAFHA